MARRRSSCCSGAAALFSPNGVSIIPRHLLSSHFDSLLAFGVLFLLGLRRRRWWPEPGTRIQVIVAGLLLIGCYSVCYLLALDHGVTPGVLATVMGVQPILTLVLIERPFRLTRRVGLALALGGLVLIVYQSIVLARVSFLGIAFALGALTGMTVGAILQKRGHQSPADVLPLQYGATIFLCLVFIPFRPFHFETSMGFLIPLLWLGLAISVIAQLLFYRLIHTGNLVNVTSLFYWVPAVTAILDYLFFGNVPSNYGILGMVAILAGLMLVFQRVRKEPQ